MAEMKDLWHFERRDFRRSVLALLNDGPASILTLFAPRRTGKTEFLIKDLAPLAEKAGHRVIYASFWQAQLSPLAVLLRWRLLSARGVSETGCGPPHRRLRQN